MNAELISYRLKRDEWETMRLLLGLQPPLGMGDISLDEKACEAAYASLCDAGLLTPCGDDVIVDRLFAFLLHQACQADICLAVRSEPRQVFLHRAPELILLSEWTLPNCRITPLPGPATARTPLFAALARCPAPLDMELLLPAGSSQAATVESADLAPDTLDRLYNAFCVQTLSNPR